MSSFQIVNTVVTPSTVSQALAGSGVAKQVYAVSGVIATPIILNAVTQVLNSSGVAVQIPLGAPIVGCVLSNATPATTIVGATATLAVGVSATNGGAGTAISSAATVATDLNTSPVSSFTASPYVALAGTNANGNFLVVTNATAAITSTGSVGVTVYFLG